MNVYAQSSGYDDKDMFTQTRKHKTIFPFLLPLSYVHAKVLNTQELYTYTAVHRYHYTVMARTMHTVRMYVVLNIS